jgi:hypothetical protein
VDLPRDPGAFGFPHLLEVSRQLPQLSVRPTQRILCALELGNIDHTSNDPDHFTVEVALGHKARPDPCGARIVRLGFLEAGREELGCAPDPRTDVGRNIDVPGQDALQDRMIAVVPQRWSVLIDMPPDYSFARYTAQLLHETVPHNEAKIAVSDRDPLVDARKNFLIESQGRLHLLFCALAVRDIARHAVIALEVSVGVIQRFAAHAAPIGISVIIEAGELEIAKRMPALQQVLEGNPLCWCETGAWKLPRQQPDIRGAHL